MNRSFFKGMAVMLAIMLAFNLLVAFAQGIQADLSDIRVIKDGYQVQMKNAQGEEMKPLMYNGSLYIPVRSFFEDLGERVTWDGSNNTVVIGSRYGYVSDRDLQRTDGSKVKLSEVAKKNTLLVFWASWCPDCIKELPVLEEISEREDVSVVMVHLGGTVEAVQEVEKTLSDRIQIFMGDKDLLKEEFSISWIPKILFLTEDLEIMADQKEMSIDEMNLLLEQIEKVREARGDFEE